jgi:hypothetical protein
MSATCRQDTSKGCIWKELRRVIESRALELALLKHGKNEGVSVAGRCTSGWASQVTARSREGDTVHPTGAAMAAQLTTLKSSRTYTDQADISNLVSVGGVSCLRHARMHLRAGGSS